MTDPTDEHEAPETTSSDVDWDTIRKRLRRVESMAGDTSERASARRAVLRERAVALARAPERVDDVERLELLEFSLGAERYAIDSAAVKEVYALKAITPVPGTPGFVLGVISVRGRIVSVVDLGRLFDSPARDQAVFTKAIVLKSPRMEFAIPADEVQGMTLIPVSELQASLPTLTGTRKKYLRGVTPGRVAVLDAARLLNDDGLVVRHERGVVR